MSERTKEQKEFIEKARELTDVFCKSDDEYDDLLAKLYDLAESIGQKAEKRRADRLYAAIQDCIDMANGRETEWGDRAEAAFACLDAAINEENQADVSKSIAKV